MKDVKALEEREFDVRELWQVIRRQIWVIAAVGISAAILMFFVSRDVLEPKYESATQIYLLNQESSPEVTYSDIQVSAYLIKDYMILATSRLVTEQVIAELGLGIKHEELIKLVHIENPDETRLINIKVQYNDPYTAKKIADAVRETTTKLITSITVNKQVSRIVEADLPERPATPDVKKNTVLGGALGILGSIFICLCKYLSDDTIKGQSCRKLPQRKPKICFAASTGGHYEQLLQLKPLIEKYDSFLVTERTEYKANEIADRKTYYLRQVNRRELLFPLKLLGNVLHSLRIFMKEKPDMVITTGVLSMIPLCLLAKMLRRKLIYIESFSKIKSPTLTGKLLYKFSDQFYIQWKELFKFFPRAIYRGGIY